MTRHPDSGRRYVYVFPIAPAFDDMRESYSKLAETRPWLRVAGPEAERQIVESEDRNELFVCFHRPTQKTLIQKRAAKVAFVYTEPLGPFESMTSDGRAYYTAFFSLASLIDGVFVHTPRMQRDMRGLVFRGMPIEILPAGLDPSVTVEVDYAIAKEHDFVSYGSVVGKRLWSVPRLSDEIYFLRGGIYGRELGAVLNKSAVSVYLAHSDVRSFSTWRIWQTLATSCALAAEGLGGQVDAWPLDPWRHYAPLPQLTQHNVDEIMSVLRGVPRAQWRQMVMTARTEILPNFTAERCVEDYLVPGAECMFGGK